MFDFLKKKIGGFVDKLTKKEEEKEPSSQAKKPPEKKPPEKTTPKVKKAEPKKEAPKKPVEKVLPEKKKPIQKVEKPAVKKPEPKKEKPAPIQKPVPVEKPKPDEKKVEEKPKPVVEKPPPVEEVKVKEPEVVEEAPKEKVEEKLPETKIETAVLDEPAPEEIVETEEPEPVEVKEEQIPEPEIPQEIPEEPVAPTEPEVEEEPQPEIEEEVVEEPAVEEPAPEPSEEPEPVEEAPEPEIEVPEKIEEQKEKPKERIKLGAFGAIKSFITKQVEISEDDVGQLLEEFELELLEADVDMSVAESIKDELREKLIGSKVKKDEIHDYINKTMKETLVDMLYNENSFDILEKVKESEKPVKIMFLGINGAGKTTTIAKVAKLLLDNNQKVVFAAADTFRAAAIEQMQVHAERLNVKVIKRDYGSDPTSVAYDAMNYAKAHGIDAVLIDTAGRQDTNISLINEMKKMTRVIEPEMTIYIGESIAGNAIIEQISSFNKEIGIDAVILTKLDCDPKGGTMLSINKVTGVPIIYVGMGQAYDDLELFDAKAIVSRIVE